MGSRVKQMSHTRKKKSPNGKSKDFQQTLSLVNRMSSMQRRLMRKLVSAVTIGTNGAGVIPLSTLCNSSGVSAYADFSSAALLYTNYRVHAFKLTFWPVLKVNTTAVNAPAYMVVAPFRSGFSATGIQQLQESPDAQSMSGYDKSTACVNYEGDNDAHLWTPTNAAVTSSESFGLNIAGSSVPATASTNTFYVLVECIVEFNVMG